MSALPMFRSQELRGRHEKRKEDERIQKAVQREALKWKKADEARLKDSSHHFIDPSFSKQAKAVDMMHTYPSLSGRVTDLLRGSFNFVTVQDLHKHKDNVYVQTKQFAEADPVKICKPTTEYFSFPESTDYFADPSKPNKITTIPKPYY